VFSKVRARRRCFSPVLQPEGTREVYFSLQSDNPNVSGFSGCNRMFGHYALTGKSLKFDQMAARRWLRRAHGTGTAVLAMFEFVAGWKMRAISLQLVDSAGSTVAGFEASPKPEGRATGLAAGASQPRIHSMRSAHVAPVCRC